MSCVTETTSSSDEVGEPSGYRSWRDNRSFSEDYSDWRDLIRGGEGSPEGILPPWVWNNLPRTTEPVFLGVAFPHVDIEKERFLAVEYAARQAQRYRELIGLAQSIAVTTSRGNYFADEVDVYIDDDGVPDLIAGAEIVAEFRDTSGSYVLVTFPEKVEKIGLGNLENEVKQVVEKERIPEIPGYRLAVGSTLRFVRLSDSLVQADENALGELLKQQNIRIVNDQEIRQSGDRGAVIREDQYAYSTGRVSGFYILYRWIEGDYVYSLGILPE